MKKSTMAYVLVVGLLVVAILVGLACRAARKAQPEPEAMSADREDATDQRKWVTVNAGETATVSAKGVEVRPTSPEAAR